MSIASKIEKLETDITNAYSKIQEKGGTIPAHKNTENLTNAIDSISGGSSTVSSLTELETQCTDAMNNFATYLKNYRSNYATGTTDAVTLYAPASNYTYYYIKKRTDGKYNIIWSYADTTFINNGNLYMSYYSIQRLGSTPLNPSSQGNATNSVEERTGYTPGHAFINLGTMSSNPYYYSTNYNTLQDALNAIKSNSTSYTLYNSASTNISPESPYKVAYTNGFVFNGDKTINPERKISSNETIEIKS